MTKSLLKGLLVVLTLTGGLSYEADPLWTTLTPDERALIDEIASTMPLDAAVGQLLVIGIPGDLGNYSGHPGLRNAIGQGIGGFIANSYNYRLPEPQPAESYRSHIFHFHNHLRSLQRETPTQLPPLIFADFEEPGVVSIEEPLIPPPPAICLTVTRNGDLVRLVGRSVALQLRSVGVDALLGPVLDIDGTPQGEYNPYIGTRTFGSTNWLVHATASHYLTGVHEGGLLAIGKHFPGHGFVNGNPHDLDVPVFTGSSENFQANLTPFRELGPHLDGLMSAHFTIPTNGSNLPLTFNRAFVDGLVRRGGTVRFGGSEIRQLGLRDTLMISDDLSDMGAIVGPVLAEDKDFGEVAVEAFAAGHDLLLFSHLETEQRKRGRFKAFDLTALGRVREALLAYVSSSPVAEDQLRDSLRRSLRLKAAVLKQWGQSVETLRDGRWRLPRPPEEDFDRPSFLVGTKYPSIRALYREVFKEAYTVVSPGDEFRLQDMNLRRGSTLFVTSNVAEGFRSALAQGYGPVTVVETRRPKSQAEIHAAAERVLSAFENSHVVVYTVVNFDDANLVQAVLTSARQRRIQDFEKRFLVLLHTTPTLLPSQTLGVFPVMGNFSHHPEALGVDLDGLRGLLTLNERRRIPVDLGDKGMFFAADQSAAHFQPAIEFPVVWPSFPMQADGRLVDYQALIERLTQELLVERKARAEADRLLRGGAELGRLGIQLLGGLVLFFGIGLLGRSLWSAITTTELISDDTWWQATFRWVQHSVRGPRRGVAVACGMVAIVIGAGLAFQVSSEQVYLAMRGAVHRWLSVEKEGDAAETTGESAIETVQSSPDGVSEPGSGATS